MQTLLFKIIASNKDYKIILKNNMPKIILKKQNWFFEGKEDEEDVVLVLHRHWFTLSVKILLVIIFTFLPFVFLVVFSSIIVKYSLISIFSFLWVTYYLLLWYWLFYIIMELILEEEERENKDSDDSHNHILVEKDGVPTPLVFGPSEEGPAKNLMGQ